MFKKQFLAATLLLTGATNYAKVTEITPVTYVQEVKQASEVVVLDVYATWCGPCKKMAPIFESLSEEFDTNKVKFVKIDFDKSGNIATSLHVELLPTFFVFKNGSVVEKIEGSKSQLALKAIIEKHI